MSLNKIDIKLYGTPSPDRKRAVETIHIMLEGRSISYRLECIEDISIFLNKNITAIPALQIGEAEIAPLRSNGSLKRSIHHILSEYLNIEIMKPTINILAPVDFSSQSVNSLRYASQLAEKVGASIDAVHVYKPSLDPTTGEVDSKKESEAMLGVLVDKVLDDVKETTTVNAVHKEGFAGEVIVDMLKDDRDLVIMSNNGSGGSIKQFFGSVSTEILDKSTCPSLFIPNGTSFKPVRTILFGFDDAPKPSILTKLVEFAKMFDAELHCVHVSYDREKEDSLPEMVKALGTYASDLSFSVSSIDNQGQPVADTLINYAKENDYDVIAIRRRHHGFIEKLFQPSVMRDLNKHLDLPLLVL